MTTATTLERLAVRALCENNHLDFCKFFFRHVFGERFRIGPHHPVIARQLERVISGECQRLIINVPPGFTKTMEAVIMFVARCIALYPDARFIHASFSDLLVTDNSTQIRDIVNSPEYQSLWPIALRADVGKKGLWRTTGHGGLLAKPADGPITGFRAGRMDAPNRFTGALIIDDPLKPVDAFSKTEREKVNRNFTVTLRNRIMVEEVPIIVIMQRLHMDDLCGYLLRGGSGDYWEHLLLPVTVDNSDPYPKEYTHGIPIEHGLADGPLWPEKFDAKKIEVLRADEYVFASQYMQNPTVAGGMVFKRDGFLYWQNLPNMLYRCIYADTAQKDGEQNDFSVFQCWGKGVDGKAYLLDQMRGKWLAPELKRNAVTFWQKHQKENEINGRGFLRCMKIEDKSSGTMLLQSLEGVPVEGIPRDTKDKYTRAMDVAPCIAAGLVIFPHGVAWLPQFESEVLSFNGSGSTHDDQVDPMMDAIADIIGTGQTLMELL